MIKVNKRPKRVQAEKQKTFKKEFTVAEQAILAGLALDKTTHGRKKYKAYLKELEEK